MLLRKQIKNKQNPVGHAGTHLLFQHSGGWCQSIVSLSSAWVTQQDPISKIKDPKFNVNLPE